MTRKAITDSISNKIKVVTVIGRSLTGFSVILIDDELVTIGTTYIGAAMIYNSGSTGSGFAYVPFNITTIKNAAFDTYLICPMYFKGTSTYSFRIKSTIVDDNHVRLTLISEASSGSYCSGANYIKVTP